MVVHLVSFGYLCIDFDVVLTSFYSLKNCALVIELETDFPSELLIDVKLTEVLLVVPFRRERVRRHQLVQFWGESHEETRVEESFPVFHLWIP